MIVTLLNAHDYEFQKICISAQWRKNNCMCLFNYELSNLIPIFVTYVLGRICCYVCTSKSFESKTYFECCETRSSPVLLLVNTLHFYHMQLSDTCINLHERTCSGSSSYTGTFFKIHFPQLRSELFTWFPTRVKKTLKNGMIRCWFSTRILRSFYTQMLITILI